MKDKQKTAVIILGPQGSGKGTQSQLLAEKISASIVGTGSLLKKEKDSKSIIGRLIGWYVNNGYLVPIVFVKYVINKELSRLEKKDTIIFDGIPRTPKQIILLDKILKMNEFTQTVAIHFDLDDATAIERLQKRGRSDDTEKVIRRRLHLYHAKINPILDAYKKRNILLRIDASMPVQAIFNHLHKTYMEFINNASV